MSITVIEQAIRQLRNKSIAAAKPRAYYKGEQASPFLGGAGRSPYRPLVETLRENHCRNVIDLPVDRMQLSGIVATDTEDMIQCGAASIAWEAWLSSRMDLFLNKWITGIRVTGRPGAIIAWPDETGHVRFWHQEPEQIAYSKSADSFGKLLWLVKAWMDDDNCPSLTVFYPDRVEVWKAPYSMVMSEAAREGFHVWQPLTMPDFASYQLIDTAPNPLGAVPAAVVERDWTDLTTVIPLQDQLNQTLASAAIAGYSRALPLRVLMGFEVEIDEDGNTTLPYRLEEDRILVAPGAEDGMQKQEVYDLQVADPTPFIEQADSIRAAIVRITRTPAHLLLQTGDFPSGEALRTAEAPFVARIKHELEEFGAAIADCAEYAARLESIIRTGTDIPDVEFECQWESPLAQADATNSRIATEWASIGIPLEIIGTDVLGWDQDKAESVAERAELDAAEKAAQAISIFDAGQTPRVQASMDMPAED